MKSRDISILDFFNTLQHEYFCAELRSKIYTKQADKDYWKTIMQHKKNKIQDIAIRNKLKSIFSDNKEYQKVFDSILCFGVPNFIYRDFHQKRKLENRDLYFYFQPGSDVKFMHNDQELTGKIKHYDLENKTVEISYLSEILTINIVNVCRIV
jgi:hypothetical protein